MKKILQIFVLILFLVFINNALYATGLDWIEEINCSVLSPGSPGEWDSGGLFPGSVVKVGNEYKMWYTGHQGTDKTEKIGYAKSYDGISWLKYKSYILDVGTTWDSRSISHPYVIYEDNIYKMWYSGRDQASYSRIGYAESLNGIDWIKIDGSQFGYQVSKPNVIKIDNIYNMWYGDIGNINDVKYATSISETNWIISNSPYFLGTPVSVIIDNGIFRMWYRKNQLLYYATSNDPINWIDQGPFNDLGDVIPAVMVDGNNYKMWYGTSDGFCNYSEYSIAVIPEPTTMLLLSAGMIGLAGLGRKKIFNKD